MPSSKPQLRANTKAKLRELFRWYGIPPSPLHSLLQEVAKQEGWIPPWEQEERLQEQKEKKKLAGKRSGYSRAALAEIRRALVQIARAGQTPQQRLQPYAEESITALRERYRKLLSDDSKVNKGPLDDLVPIILGELSDADRKKLRKVGRETLKKDLKQVRRQSGITR